MLEKMKAMVKAHGTCVLATAAKGRPHCSLMTYVTDDDCREIYMVTQKDSQKYRNLIKNPNVSLLIDNREQNAGSSHVRTTAMTVSGTFRTIENALAKKRAMDRLLERHPHLNAFAGADAEVVCVRISSFLLLDGLKDAYFEKR